MKLRRLLIIPDCHRPYHHDGAWRLMLKAAKKFRPDRLVLLGDFGDFDCVSSHARDPNRARGLEHEIASCNEGLDELDDLGIEEKHFVAGNHEHRLERFLADKAPELFNVIRVEKLLRLRERGWNYTPYRQHQRIGKLYVTHDTGSAGANANAKAMAAFGGNAVIGHTHRISVTYAGNAKGESHVGAMFGWLGDPDAAKYLHDVQKRLWQHGIGVGYMEPSGTVHLQAVPFLGGRCVIDGQLVTL